MSCALLSCPVSSELEPHSSVVVLLLVPPVVKALWLELADAPM
jgi:hypothetical protein